MMTYADGRRDGLALALKIVEPERVKTMSDISDLGVARREIMVRIAAAIRREIGAAQL
jgi:hypothetical protein